MSIHIQIGFNVHIHGNGLNDYSPTSDSWVEILTPKLMVWGGRALGRCLVMNGISTLIKRPQRDPSPLPSSETQNIAIYEPGSGPHQTLTPPASWCWTSSLRVRKKFLLFIRCPVYGIGCRSSNWSRHTCNTWGTQEGYMLSALPMGCFGLSQDGI